MFSCDVWDGLAKIGTYEVKNKSIRTPALFPVVDPAQQDIEINRFNKEFGIDQVITSAYLLSKRMDQNRNWEEYPKIHKYLDFSGMVMMDSGAYQVMLYGDIDLGVIETIKLQKSVETDIGVIMDHPIGNNVGAVDAAKRIDNTLSNIQLSINEFGESPIKWTLPIQGGRYLDLLRRYLKDVKSEDIMNHFSMYALGSVVPLMIAQDYSTLVKMIAIAKYNLPVTFPLHLFGAGHPAMFALATFLGCDTYDSAAYSLMAKDRRYMTVEGTYHLESLDEFPCSCKVCVSHTVREVLEQEKKEQRKNIAEHNLWVSAAEIRRIRNSIRMGRLWDLVQQRASSVPKLARATRLAMDFVTSGKLKVLYESGIPISSISTVKVSRKVDIKKVELKRIKSVCNSIFSQTKIESMIILAYSLEESIYNKIPIKQISKTIKSNQYISLLLPPFGLVPIGLNELYPIGQLVHDLEINDFDKEDIIDQLSTLKKNGLNELTIISPYSWPKSYYQGIEVIIENTIITHTEKPFTALLQLLDRDT